jgi:hypothetical protein
MMRVGVARVMAVRYGCVASVRVTRVTMAGVAEMTVVAMTM